MRAICLLAVLVIAHILSLAGRPVPLSAWTPIAYLWQDVLVALVFAGIDKLVRLKPLSWTLYAAIVFYAAVNVPVALTLSSPLTWAMIRAARGPLSDSILHELTFTNAAAAALVITCGIVFPFLLKLRPRAAWIVPALAIVAAGPTTVSKIDTMGMHRNAITALWPLKLRHVSAHTETGDWRTSPFDAVSGEYLSNYRGAAAGRNVVLIILESTGARYLRPYGAPEDPMPNLTALASRSIVFENAYAVYPESIKGLYSTLCSRYPAFETPPETYAQAACPSIAEQLANLGYHTALFHSGRFMYLGMQSVIEHRGFQVLEDAGAISGNINSSFGVDEPSTVRRMLSWIDSAPKNEPFFLTYLPIAGHHPYAAPEGGPFADDYLNALHYGDKALGELFQGLRARGLDEKTLFVIFGDHGEAFGQHQGNFGHTLFIYDENVRVPYLISAPGLIRNQIRVDRVASLIDTSPTILDLLGLSFPQQIQGSSLLDSTPRMALFFTDYSLGWLGLRDSCWKYLYETNSSRSKLYEVCKDPAESVDISSRESKRGQLYRSTLERWIAAQEVALGR